MKDNRNGTISRAAQLRFANIMNIPNAPSTAHDDYNVTSKQVATSEASAWARLDPGTEGRLYRLYRAYFQYAEDSRAWNLWEDIDWTATTTAPSSDLAAQVAAMWREDSFLPDSMGTLLQTLRASRGRAWFVARWAYEEGKHLLALGEWLTRASVYTANELKDEGYALLTEKRWVPPLNQPNALMVEALLWEMRQIERARELRRSADAEGDAALVSLATFMIADHEAHRDFFRSSLQIIREAYPEPVHEAAARMAQILEYPGGERAILSLLDA